MSSTPDVLTPPLERFPEPDLVHVLQAMGDPVRLAILKSLADNDWHPCGTGDWQAHLHKSTVSHHMRVLREAGLVESEQRGRNKYAHLLREVVEARFPGLLEGVLQNA